MSAGLATRPIQGGRPTPYAAEVLAVVDRIPPGKVMSYGDVAEFVGRGSGRAVGAVMSLIASVTMTEPIDAQSTPSTPPSAQEGTIPGGGGTG